MDCFENIIGFTRTTCVCFAPCPGGITSESGLYMDELPESEHILRAVKSSADCGKDMCYLFESARRNAISEFKERLFSEVGTRFQVKQNPFIGLIGQLNFTSAHVTTSAIVGAAYEMQPLGGGMLRVRKIFVGTNTASTVEVNIYKAYVSAGMYIIQGAALGTYTILTVANTATPYLLPVPLDLPLTDDSSNIIHYLAVMELPPGVLPLDFKAACACNTQALLEKWMLPGGIEGTDINHLLLSSRRTGTNANINGIILEADIKCSDTGFMCENYASNPFIKVTVQKAIQFQAVANLLATILRSDDVSRYALTKREQMATDSAILHNKFKSRVTWISENLDMGVNNCYVCNTVTQANGPYKAGIVF